MAKAMTPEQLLGQLRKWRVPFKEYPGWRTRGRPGGITPEGMVIHHTGSDIQSDSYLDFLFERGRPEDDLPGPLCHVATDMDGDLHLGAIGRANHAGPGSQSTLNAVRAESHNGYRVELKPGPDSINGNAWYYGNEVRYDGNPGMRAAQYRTALLYAAAVFDWYGWSALRAIGHREHTRRKGDPGNCPMNTFRTDLRALLNAGADYATGGDDMAAGDVERMLAAINGGRTEASDRYEVESGRYKRYEAMHAQDMKASAESIAAAKAVGVEVRAMRTELGGKLETLTKAVEGLTAAVKAGQV